jgi:hypothetical protein
MWIGDFIAALVVAFLLSAAFALVLRKRGITKSGAMPLLLCFFLYWRWPGDIWFIDLVQLRELRGNPEQYGI